MEALSYWVVIPAAFALDLLWATRSGFPTRCAGWAGRSPSPNPGFGGFRQGRFFRRPVCAALVTGAWALSGLAVGLCRQAHPALGFAVEVMLVYFCLSVRSLNDAAVEVFSLLKLERADEARGKVAMIVGRDVENYEARNRPRHGGNRRRELRRRVLSPLFLPRSAGRRSPWPSRWSARSTPWSATRTKCIFTLEKPRHAWTTS